MIIPDAVRQALAEHAEAEKPNEACGLLALRDGVAERYHPARNAAVSPYRFELDVDPEVWFLEDEGYELAVFHSHLLESPAPVPHGCREHRPLGRKALRDLDGLDRRARCVAHRERAHPCRATGVADSARRERSRTRQGRKMR